MFESWVKFSTAEMEVGGGKTMKSMCLKSPSMLCSASDGILLHNHIRPAVFWVRRWNKLQGHASGKAAVFFWAPQHFRNSCPDVLEARRWCRNKHVTSGWPLQNFISFFIAVFVKSDFKVYWQIDAAPQPLGKLAAAAVIWKCQISTET